MTKRDSHRQGTAWRIFDSSSSTRHHDGRRMDDEEKWTARSYSSVEHIICARLGKTNGRVRSAADVHALVHALSSKASCALVSFSAAMLVEAGNVMLALMAGETRPFIVELLLPWARQIALLEPRGSLEQLSRARQTELKAGGFCLAHPADCLVPLLDYTLIESVTGLPEKVATFWRTLALAAPPLQDGMSPHNIAPIATWLTLTATRQTTDRHQQTCRTLALFVKGLALQTREEIEAQKAFAGIKKGKGLTAMMMQAKLAETCARSLSPDKTMATDQQRKRAQQVVIMQQAAQQRREKSTRNTILAHDVEKQRRLQHETQLDHERACGIEQQVQEQWNPKEAMQFAKSSIGEDAMDVLAGVELRGGLEMKLADGRHVGPALLMRMAREPQGLGVPKLDLERAREKQRGRERQRAAAAAKKEEDTRKEVQAQGTGPAAGTCTGSAI